MSVYLPPTPPSGVECKLLIKEGIPKAVKLGNFFMLGIFFCFKKLCWVLLVYSFCFCHHLHSLGDSCLVIMMIFLILFPPSSCSSSFLSSPFPPASPPLPFQKICDFCDKFSDLFYYPHMPRGLVVSRTLHFFPDNLPLYCIQLIPSRGLQKYA